MADISKVTIDQAKAGNQEAFEQLYDAYFDRVARYALRRVLDHSAAEDIAANVWLKIAKKLKSFKWKHENSFVGWIFRITNNEVHQYFRAQGSYRSRFISVDRGEMAKIEQSDEQLQSSAGFDEQLDEHSRFSVLHRHIARLKRRDQEIIHMSFFERLNSEEIGSALKMKPSSVRMAQKRALQKLQAYLRNEPLFKDMAQAAERSAA